MHYYTDKYCPGCNQTHPLDEFAITKGGHTLNCRAFNRTRENAQKAAPKIRETELNRLINKVWR